MNQQILDLTKHMLLKYFIEPQMMRNFQAPTILKKMITSLIPHIGENSIKIGKPIYVSNKFSMDISHS